MTPFTLTLPGGRLLSVERPVVMAVINATPDSFYEGSRCNRAGEAAAVAERLVSEGADWLDIGGCSTRPGADLPGEAEEIDRIGRALCEVRKAVGKAVPVSVDTFRANVAREAIENLGADIINDISGGLLDENMFATAAAVKAPYILTHTRGTPAEMQSLTDYPSGVTAGVVAELQHRLDMLELEGVNDIIVDPGLGFAKTLEQNYRLLTGVDEIRRLLSRPVLIGLSRKSMITRLLEIEADRALAPTMALNLVALSGGAAIIRVHDAREGSQAVKLALALANKFPQL